MEYLPLDVKTQLRNDHMKGVVTTQLPQQLKTYIFHKMSSLLKH